MVEKKDEQVDEVVVLGKAFETKNEKGHTNGWGSSVPNDGPEYKSPFWY